MYVIDHLNQVITNSQGQSIPLRKNSEESLRVKHVVVQLIDATTVQDGASAILLQQAAAEILQANDAFHFPKESVFNLLQEILKKAQLLVPVKAAVHEGIVYKEPVITEESDAK